MTMRRYEVVYVLAPTLSQEEVDQFAETYSQAAREQGAEVISVDKWEKRKLAFRVKKYWEGYYTILTIEEEAADAVTELERRFKVHDSVIRFLTVRIDEELKRAAKFRQAGQDDDAPEVADDVATEDESEEDEKPVRKPARKTQPKAKESGPAEESTAGADSGEEAEAKPVKESEEE